MTAVRKYSDELLEKVKRLRSSGWSWRKISLEVGFSQSGLKSAILYRNGSTGQYTPDRMPCQLSPWPAGVDFRPDEMEVRS